MSDQGAEALAGLIGSGVQRLSGIDLPQAAAGQSIDSLKAIADAAPTGEPVFDAAATADIQGNVIPGFNKDYQRFLFLSLSEVEAARSWLHWLAPRLSSMQEVLDFRREFRRERLLTGQTDPSKAATWTAFAVSRTAIVKLLGKEALGDMGDEAFRQGMASRSTYLGDPTQPATPGHRDGWCVGGTDSEADFLVIVAADTPEDLNAAAAEILERAASNGLTITFDQACANLPGELAGHEHSGSRTACRNPASEA
ncbi:hypothetical protein D0Z08_19390 [Nocardioides immobilis]|uniref:DyP dimeric alpha+beta barrel domain-containing protein n=1 Tax=Nocardioides immobilis TaxID=2049295 RepID=A0A417XYF4_9ACTN|nr:hypothetical protein [Nocardioides immobilis]RHW25394.1 hypothetical protein D0Z08_19390 [Nocardioides immobilis]